MCSYLILFFPPPSILLIYSYCFQNFKKQDAEARERMEAKNKLENYAFSVKGSINEEALKDKLTLDDKSTINHAVEDTLKWLDTNQSASKEEFNHKFSELEHKVNPIMSKLYQGAGGVGAGQHAHGGQEHHTGGHPNSGGRGGPTVEEVD